MRYLLIDHITEYSPGQYIKGIKNVAMSEDFLEFHFPRNPIMPGVMLLEAAAQLTGWLEAASSGFKNWFLISSVNKSNFYGFAFPGDQVELEVRLLSEDGAGRKVYEGLGMVKGRKKIRTEFEGETVPLDDIEDAGEQENFFRVLTRDMKR